MAENPTKHSELIEPGNPYEEAIKGLNEMIKLFNKLSKNLKKTGKEYLDFTKKQNVQTKQGRENIKKMAVAVDKLTAEEKEALRIKKALEREQAKLNQLDSKAYRQLIQTREAVKKKNAELRKSSRAMDGGAKSTNRWGKALGSFAFKFNALGNIAANALSRITQGLTRAIRESIQLAAKAEGVRTAFNALGRDDFLKDLQKATRGTVDNITLMQAAVQAKNFKIPLEQLATFFEFATSRAIQTGESVDFLVNSIITGIGRKSVLVMDNLGISAVELQEEIKLVGDFGLAAGRIIQREIALAGDVADTAATKMANLKVRFENFKEELGRKAGAGIKSQLDYFDALEVILADMDTDAIKRMSAFVGFMKEKDVFSLAESIEQANIEKLGRDIFASQVNLKELFSTIDGFDFKTSGLWAMTMAIADLPEGLPEIEQITDLLSDDDIVFDPLVFDVDNAAQNEAMTRSFLENKKKEFREADAEITKSENEALAERNKMIAASFAIASDLVGRFTNLFAAQKEKELSAAGDNAAKREAIEKKFAKKEQALAIVSAVISTAQGVARAFGDFPFPYALIPAAIIGALGAAEISTIAGQSFAEGGSGLLDDKGGVLPGKSHAQGGVDLGAIGEAERGEYFGIVNKQMAKKYGGELPGIFDSLNNGSFHDVWGGRTISSADPYNKKIYEVMINTPQYVPEGKRVERYPNGRTRIING